MARQRVKNKNAVFSSKDATAFRFLANSLERNGVSAQHFIGKDSKGRPAVVLVFADIKTGNTDFEFGIFSNMAVAKKVFKLINELERELLERMFERCFQRIKNEPPF